MAKRDEGELDDEGIADGMPDGLVEGI